MFRETCGRREGEVVLKEKRARRTGSNWIDEIRSRKEKKKTSKTRGMLSNKPKSGGNLGDVVLRKSLTIKWFNREEERAKVQKTPTAKKNSMAPRAIPLSRRGKNRRGSLSGRLSGQEGVKGEPFEERGEPIGERGDVLQGKYSFPHSLFGLIYAITIGRDLFQKSFEKRRAVNDNAKIPATLEGGKRGGREANSESE